MTDDDPPVRLILDRSALRHYLAGSMHVAEPLHEVIADRVRFGVPCYVAVEALAAAGGAALAALHGLLRNPACVVLPDLPGDVPELVFWRRATGSFERAVCAVPAVEWDAPILTADVKAYGDDLPVIDIPA